MYMDIYSTWMLMLALTQLAWPPKHKSQLQADPVNEPLCFSEKAQVAWLEVPVDVGRLYPLVMTNSLLLKMAHS